MNPNRVTPENITSLKAGEVFVFGSNLIRRKKIVAGAAYVARRWGSGLSHAVGREGQTYAIPTVDNYMRPLSLIYIDFFVRDFIEYAKKNPNEKFLVTAVGTGLAGHGMQNIANMFVRATEVENISLPESFWKVLDEKKEEKNT